MIEKDGKPALEVGWQSRELARRWRRSSSTASCSRPRAGSIADGAAPVGGERAKRSKPAVLYALDAATGKEIWSSGTAITSFARAGLSAGGGQVYLVTYDNTLYAFGIPMEH